jgi:hypothetical protein
VSTFSQKQNKMTEQAIIKLLSKCEQQSDVKRFAQYCMKGLNDEKSTWFRNYNDEKMAALFLQVEAEGLVFDGVHVTLQIRGLNYDYVAYKNKMLLVYPETLIDLQMVYKEDTFNSRKENGKVVYRHEIANPFGQVDADIVGSYCIIKNKRGEFITTLSKADLDKHRNIAKTDFIWQKWFVEMCLKTIIRKAVKYHFEDVYASMNEVDNQHIDLENVTDEDPIDVIKDRIREAFEHYQGEDLVDIRNLCTEKQRAGEFTVQFGKSILEQITVQNV